MKVYRLPNECAAILFDMDSTLYTNPEYIQSQVNLLIERFAGLDGKGIEQTSEKIAQYKKDWARDHNGRQISLGNTLAAFGISIRENSKWREELFKPEEFLREDAKLRSVLEQLESQFILSVVSNNPVSIVSRTLSVLGVEDLFHAVIGLDTCGASKPNDEMFMRAAILSAATPESCLSVGDRYDIDIALPLELGMGGILVDGVEDVYRLPELLL